MMKKTYYGNRQPSSKASNITQSYLASVVKMCSALHNEDCHNYSVQPRSDLFTTPYSRSWHNSSSLGQSHISASRKSLAVLSTIISYSVYVIILYPVWLGHLTHLLREAQSHWPPFCFHSQLCKNDTHAAYRKTRMPWNWHEYFNSLQKLGHFQQV